jgi:hypothetical protein
MSDNLIKNLPLEIVIKILENLEFRELKNASLVCKQWNIAVSISNKFLDKALYRSTFSQSSIRNYRHLALINVSKNYDIPRYRNQLLDFSCFIRSLYLYDINVLGDIFMKFLQSCDLLEELHLVDIKNQRSSDGNTIQPTAQVYCLGKNIKEFELISCEWMLDHLTIENVSMKEISLTCPKYLIHNVNSDVFKFQIINFLNRLNNIKVQKLALKYPLDCNLELTPKFEWNELILETKFLMNNFELNHNWTSIFKSASENSKLDLRCNFCDQFSMMPSIYVLNVISTYSAIKSVVFHFHSKFFYFINDTEGYNDYDSNDNVLYRSQLSQLIVDYRSSLLRNENIQRFFLNTCECLDHRALNTVECEFIEDFCKVFSLKFPNAEIEL